MILQFNQLQTKIKEAESVLLVSHKNPDPDTIGSAIALGNYIESFGKNINYFCINNIPDNFSFLKGVEKFKNDIEVFKRHYDLVIFLDCGDLNRCGVKNILDYKKQFWALIDHHLDKEADADLVIKNNNASAVSEMIYEFFKYSGFSIKANIATALLSGILIDTNFLSNSATKGESTKIASELSSLSADYRSILKSFYFNKHPNILKIWGKALSRLKHNKDKNITTTVILEDDEKDKALDEAMEGFANFLSSILISDIIMVFKEKDGKIRGNLRTVKDNIDVSQIAQEYGGGGHQKAAGFSCKGRLVEEKDEWRVERA